MHIHTYIHTYRLIFLSGGDQELFELVKPMRIHIHIHMNSYTHIHTYIHTYRLIFLCGGDKELFELVKPMLDVMGKKSLFLGMNVCMCTCM